MMLRRQCSKCKGPEAEAVMASVKLSGEVEHEAPVTKCRETEVVECCQDKKMASESTFSGLKSKIFLKFGNMVKEEGLVRPGVVDSEAGWIFSEYEAV